MSISQKLEKCYKNQIENIKNEKNYEFKIKQIGALVLDVCGRCISTISTAIGCCRAFVKKCYIKVRDKLEIKSNKNRCGRKKITEKYPELKNDIRKIIEEKSYTDPHFQTVAKTDSVYLKDSVFVHQKGDTVMISKIAYRDRYHNIYKVKLDTIFMHDSIEVPLPCERTLTKSEQRLMTLGRCYIAFLFLVVVVGIGFVFWYHNKKC